jgi:hypothetical protein
MQKTSLGNLHKLFVGQAKITFLMIDKPFDIWYYPIAGQRSGGLTNFV